MKIIVFSGDYSAIYATTNRTRFMNAKPALAALLMTAMLFASPAAIADQRTLEDIPSNAAGTGIHDSLVAALDRADLVATLSGDGPFTVFAPTIAFTAAGIDPQIPSTQMVKSRHWSTFLPITCSRELSTSSQVTDGMTATMLNGDDVTFSVTDGTVMIGDATVNHAADVMASNGIIHVIDMVLMVLIWWISLL